MIFLWFLLIFVEIFDDFGWFFAIRIRIRFIEADPDPADQNETDPNGSGSETLLKRPNKNFGVKRMKKIDFYIW